MVNPDDIFADAAPRTARKAGGDDGVERDGNGRPRIIVDCDKCETTGKIPSEKVEGRLNKCPKCKGEGRLKRSYTRVTTFIDALEDKENLLPWKMRMVLKGVALDPGFLKDVETMDVTEDRDVLNRRAEAAAELAGASEKADHGTLLHELSEQVDKGETLPLDVDFDDFIDIEAYSEKTVPLVRIIHIEQLVVCDELGTAGTPDRVSSVRPDVTLSAPDGHVFTVDEEIITDLKTGRLDYGMLKMAMQLSIYSRSKRYDKETGERIDLGNVNQKWGIIMGLTPGSGELNLYWVDLELGWEAVQLAALVRDMRRRGRKALLPFAEEAVALSPAA